MNAHITTGRWRLGLALSITSAFLWGVLPIALKGLLDYMDAYTITWYRFFVAGTFLFIFVTWKNGLPPVSKLRNSAMYLTIAVSVGLCGNYILYILGLDYQSPSTATIVIQLAPMLMLMGSLVVFKEQFSIRQWIGFLVLVIGLILFFNNHLDELLYQLSNYKIGVLLISAAAASWAMYALAQKQLLRSFPSETIMLFIYLSGMMLFFPFAKPVSLVQLDGLGLTLLGFCAFNTLLAYGSFAEALDHWEASRVSMVLSITPLITIAGMRVCSVIFPGFINPEQLNNLSISGAFLVVAGSMLCSLSRVNNMKTINK